MMMMMMMRLRQQQYISSCVAESCVRRLAFTEEVSQSLADKIEVTPCILVHETLDRFLFCDGEKER